MEPGRLASREQAINPVFVVGIELGKWMLLELFYHKAQPLLQRNTLFRPLSRLCKGQYILTFLASYHVYTMQHTCDSNAGMCLPPASNRSAARRMASAVGIADCRLGCGRICAAVSWPGRMARRPLRDVAVAGRLPFRQLLLFRMPMASSSKVSEGMISCSSIDESYCQAMHTACFPTS